MPVGVWVVPGVALATLAATTLGGDAIRMTVDVAARTVTVGVVTEDFQIADYAQWRLLEGLDDIALTLRHETAIEAFEADRPAWLPAVAASGDGPAGGN